MHFVRCYPTFSATRVGFLVRTWFPLLYSITQSWSLSAIKPVLSPTASIVLLVMMYYQLLETWNMIKKNDDSEIVSDHIIYSCDWYCNLIHIYAETRFDTRWHVNWYNDPYSKRQMGTFVHIWQFRAISLSSILCKLFDVVKFIKEKGSLCTSDLQVWFQTGFLYKFMHSNGARN